MAAQKSNKKDYAPPSLETEDLLYTASLACGKCESVGQPTDHFNCSVSGANS